MRMPCPQSSGQIAIKPLGMEYWKNTDLCNNESINYIHANIKGDFPVDQTVSHIVTHRQLKPFLYSGLHHA